MYAKALVENEEEPAGPTTSEKLQSLTFGLEVDAAAAADVVAETEREIYISKVRASVQQDIKKVLGQSTTYQRHVKGPVVLSRPALESLSKPKTGRLHPENQMLHDMGVSDHAEYARRKAEELEAQRKVEEARLAREEEEQKLRNGALKAFKNYKQEVGP